MAKTILLTGANGDIGIQLANELCKRGHEVIALVRNIKDINKNLNASAIYECDLNNIKTIEEVISGITNEHNSVDILINNAGIISPIGKVNDTTAKQWLNSINVNLIAAYLCSKALLPSFLDNHSGLVLNINSGAANQAIDGWSPYCVSKAGLKMFNECFSNEYAKYNIYSLSVSLPAVATNMQHKIFSSKYNPLGKSIDFKSLQDPKKVARKLAKLCEVQLDHLSGKHYSLDYITKILF